MKDKSIDQKLVTISLSKLISLVIAIVLTTNAVSLTIQRLNVLEQRQIYNSEANKRRLEHAKRDLRQEADIIELKKELKECRNKKQ